MNPSNPNNIPSKIQPNVPPNTVNPQVTATMLKNIQSGTPISNFQNLGMQSGFPGTVGLTNYPQTVNPISTMPPTPPIKSSVPIPTGQSTIPSKVSVEPPKPAPNPQENDIISRAKLQQLVNQITANNNSTLDIDVQEILLDVADDFIESVTTFACNLAKHRKSTTLEVKDLQLPLERNWNIRIPGFSSVDDGQPPNKLLKRTTGSSSEVDVHQARKDLVKKAQVQASKKLGEK